MASWITDFLQQVKATSALEWLAAVFGVISVLFAQRNHIFLYPAGLVSTGIYAYLWSRQEAGLYAEALLNIYYFVMTVYGWYHWMRGKGNEKEIPVSMNSGKDWLVTISIVVVLWSVFYLLLLKTPSTVPLWDSFASASACAGMWLLTRRKVENWLVLNLSNLVSIPLFIYKHYYVTTILTFVLFIVAISGYFQWKKLYKQSKTGEHIRPEI